MRKRTLALVLCMLMLATSAQAAIMPELEALIGRVDQGLALHLTLSAQIQEWPAVSAQTLPVVQNVLQDTKLDMTVSNQTVQATLHKADAALAGLFLDSLADGREALTLTPGGLTYIADAGQLVNSFLLQGERVSAPLNGAEWLAVLIGVRRTLPNILFPLDDYGNDRKQSISIKNVGTARSRIEYTLSAEEWNALWPLVLYQLEQSTEFAQSIGTTLHKRVLNFLGTITFESKCTLKRFLDTDGADMGWQFTGQVGHMGSNVRKVTLYGGINDATGLYLSLKLPAISGRENLSLVASFTWKERKGTTTMTGDFNLKTVTGPDSITEHIKVNLKRGGENQALTGKVVWDSSTGGTVKQKSSLTIKPELIAHDNMVDGTLDVLMTAQGSTAFAGLLTVSLQPADMPTPPPSLRTVDLSLLTEKQLMEERNTLSNLVAMPLWMYASQLPDAQRRSFLHDLGRDTRTQGETVPVMDLPELIIPDSAQAEDYVVDMEE
ncbi:MAG: hypothetical protein ACOX55_12415 [Christensenellales bacterium]